MERVLTINTASDPIELVVVGVYPPTDPKLPNQLTAESLLIQEVCRINRPIPAVDSEVTANQLLADEIVRSCLTLTKEWDSSVLLVSGADQVAINVSMPFSDPKKVSKLITSEIQDNTPFNIEDFTVDHHHIGSLNGSGEGFHVEMLANDVIEPLLKSLSDAPTSIKVEPRIISTPGGVIGGIYNFFTRDLEPDSIILFETNEWFYITCVINKKVISERAVPRKLFTDPANLIGIIEAFIRAVEERHSHSIKNIYYVSETTAIADGTVPSSTVIESLRQGHRAIKELSMVTLFPTASSKVSLTTLLAASYAKEYPSPKPISNFRTGKFAYRPSFTPLGKGLSSLNTYIFYLVSIIILSLTGWYSAREYTIHQLRETLLSSIQASIPSFNADSGAEAKTLQQMSQSLQDALKELGSPLAAPPLSVLSVISEDLSSIEGITVNRLTIRNGEVKIDGSVPNYRNLNRLEATLKKRKSLFCRSRTDSPTTSSGKDNARDFQLTLTLCE